jgi:hypothetical protein
MTHNLKQWKKTSKKEQSLKKNQERKQMTAKRRGMTICKKAIMKKQFYGIVKG